MKKCVLMFVLSVMALSVVGQKNMSKPTSFNVQKQIKPAILSIVPNSVKFEDATGNNAIDAVEQCSVKFKVTNSGMGAGYGCVARISGTGTMAGIKLEQKTLSIIPVGGTIDVTMPISTNMNTQDGQVTLSFQVDEPNGFGTDPMRVDVATRAFEAPFLQVTDYTVTGTQSAVIEKKEIFDLQVVLQNMKYGLAEDVSVSIELPNGVMLLEGEERAKFATLEAGEQRSLVYSLITNNNYAAETIPIKIRVKEKYGKYAEDKNISLAMNQNFTSGGKIVVQERIKQQGSIVVATLTSDVDKNIPQSTKTNNNSFAFIIANENYKYEEPVAYAKNDGEVFAEYCRRTLGMPQKNVKVFVNATLNDMNRAVSEMKNIAKAYEGDLNIVFYYAGHGIPDDKNRDGYLLPIDGYGSSVTTGYSINQLYSELGKMQVEQTVVLLDACFSGVKRDDAMLAQNRGVRIAVKSGVTSGNTIAFTAATGDETAHEYAEQRHGMFTYFLLKKLQETEGNVNLDELFDYVSRNVKQVSAVDGNPQTPSKIVSPHVGDNWRAWTLK